MSNNGNNSGPAMEATETESAGELSTSAERVGFCRPPEASRFKRGMSGNPKGRPRGASTWPRRS